MKILTLSYAADNYAYILLDEHNAAVVVDPGSAECVQNELSQSGALLKAVLCTHHHGDHTAGAAALLRQHPAAECIRWEGRERSIAAGSLNIQMIHTPGHTADSVCFLAGDALFTGDTVFGAGCGRLFEGTPEQMHQSFQRIQSLPADTRLYYGHEYTLDNLAFAAHVEPQNAAIEQRRRRTEELLNRGEPAVGITLEEEQLTNPFMRPGADGIRHWIEQQTGSKSIAEPAAFGLIRTAKDSFQG